MSSHTLDLTKGSPFRLILQFALPVLAGIVLQNVYNIVDTIIVGRFLGVAALAGVGATGSINFLIIGGVSGITAGFALPIAQRFGAKDAEGLRKYAGNAYVLSVMLAVSLTLATVLLCRPVLMVMQTPDDIIDLSHEYIGVIFAGIPATMAYNLLASFMRSLGNSKVPMIFLFVSVVLNIILDILFITVFQMGIFGAAFATVLAQAISAVLCLLYIIRRMPELHVTRKDLRLSFFHVNHLLGMGLPMGLQYSITAIGCAILQTFVNQLGSTPVASIAAASKVNGFLLSPLDAVSSTMAIYAGQNLGANRPERIPQGLRTAMLMQLGYVLLINVIVFFTKKALMLPFLSPEDGMIADQIAELGSQWLQVSVFSYVLFTIISSLRFTLQGVGHSRLAMLSGAMELIGRTITGFFLIPNIGFMGACLADPSAWFCSALILIPIYFHIKKKMLSQTVSDIG